MVGKKGKDSYWSGIAERYAALPPPLRISASELEIYEKLASRWSAGSSGSGAPVPKVRVPRVLVLGATPDFYHMPWPEGTDLLAVDFSAGMLSEVWPGGETQSLGQDWCTMDLPDASRDLALCDGGLSFLKYPDGLKALAENLGRIIAAGGLFIVRLYVDADHHESADAVMLELLQGRIKNSSELKLRLWLALNSRGDAGVRLDDVWRSFNTRCSRKDIPWPDGEWQSMQAYENMQDHYYFHSVERVTEILANSNSPFSLEAKLRPTGHCNQHLRLLSFRRCS